MTGGVRVGVDVGGTFTDLVAVTTDALVQVAAVVEEADRDQRHAEVAGRLEVIAGEHAQAAGIELE